MDMNAVKYNLTRERGITDQDQLLLTENTQLRPITCSSAAVRTNSMKCHLCTVTGPTVVDIQGRVDSVQDLCAYSLMESETNPGVQVQASFHERRRRDVSFLNRVILYVQDPGVHIYLEQGGEVKLNKQTLTLDATATVVHGMELSKDESGVTAKTSHLNHNLTVFFDGYTALMHIEGPTGSSRIVTGLCGNSSSFRISELTDISETNCDAKYEDTADSTFNRIAMTEHCNLLKEAPFRECHSHVDPEPYFTACNDTLSKYPAGDGLNCQFFEAYAKACSLYSKDAIDGWRSNVNCSAEPQAFCQGRFCSSHEFCGETSSGTRCFCRAVFASTVTSEKPFGEAVTCNGSSRVATLYGCLLEDKGISYSDLHLFDTTCISEMDHLTHVVSLSLDTNTKPCGSIIKMNNESEIINKNGVMLETNGMELVDFTCPFTFPDIDIDFSVIFQVKSGFSNPNTVAYVTSGIWNYTLSMRAYMDAHREYPVTPNTQLKLNQKVWLELQAAGVDEKIVALVTENCYATSDPSPHTNLKYDLITNGCANPADDTVVIESNGERLTDYFSFNMFKFNGNSRDMYLHCRLNLCLKSDNSCTRSCGKGARRRRSYKETHDETDSIVIMAWGI
ncbi:alpha-tectorin-like [Eleginops maclovinus]|uniref:alpha-tectorin-like n=1 Tax=Eleginops maclovinus TaxID=56733 RepID=UPI0030803192